MFSGGIERDQWYEMGQIVSCAPNNTEVFSDYKECRGDVFMTNSN